jgi:hypothetical protein
MKKYFIIFSLLIAGMALFAQNPYSAIVRATATTTDTVIGKTAETITIADYIPQEYDYSYQIIPTKVGSGDSTYFAAALWVSNDYAGTSWTEITTARDTSSVAGADGVLIEGTDAKNMRHRIVCTGLSLDSVQIKIYYVYKLDKPWNQ